MDFYVENPRHRRDGLMCWWEVCDRGYIYDIERARVFTQGEVEEKLSIQVGDKIAWPKSYIDKVACAGFVMFRDCDIAEAWKGE